MIFSISIFSKHKFAHMRATSPWPSIFAYLFERVPWISAKANPNRALGNWFPNRESFHHVLLQG